MHTRAVEKVNALVTEDNMEREQIAAASIRNSVVVLLTVNLAGLLAIVLISLYISRTISKPIRELKEVADKLALGEVDIEIKADTKDEIGDLM
jgi:methyl-accepting chemotaxis protein